MAKAGIVYTGTDDGVIVLSDPGGTGRWRRIGHTLQGHAVRSMYPQNALEVLVAADGAGVQRSADGGQSWQPLLAMEAALVTGHAGMPGRFYVAARDGLVQRSDDNGATWQTILRTGVSSGVVSLLVAPHDARQLYLAHGRTLWLSDDGGDTWAEYPTAAPADVDALVAAPERDGVLFAVIDGGVCRFDVNAAWQPIDMVVGGPGYQLALAVLAGQPEVLLAALSTPDSAMVVRKDGPDAGWRMAKVATPLKDAVTVIVPSTYHMDTAWAGTAAGQLLRSSDRGRTWEQIAEEAAAVRSLAVVRLM